MTKQEEVVTVSNEEIIRNMFVTRSKNIKGHDPWRYGEELSEFTDKIEFDWIVNNFDIGENDSIIDVGCGTGRHVLMLAELTKAGRIVGCDFVSESIDFLNERIGEMGLYHASGVCCNATDFSKHVGVESCNIVVAIGVVQYLTNEEHLASFSLSCSDLLNPGGNLILKHPLSLTQSFILDYYRDEMETRYVSHYYNLPDIMKFFEENFELMRIERTFTKFSVGEKINEVERDPRARQMWICLEKKK